MVENAEVQKFLYGRTMTELRERAVVVADVVGLVPTQEGPWSRYAWENGGGDAAVWFFHEDERALLLTVDHESDLNLYSDGDGDGQRDLFRGLPDDMLELVVGREDEAPLLTMPYKDTRVTFATGVFWFDGTEWRIAEGLSERIDADESLRLRDTGIRFCLSPYNLRTDYEPGTFTYERI